MTIVNAGIIKFHVKKVLYKVIMTNVVNNHSLREKSANTKPQPAD